VNESGGRVRVISTRLGFVFVAIVASVSHFALHGTPSFSFLQSLEQLAGLGLEDGDEVDGIHVRLIFPSFHFGKPAFIAFAGELLDVSLGLRIEAQSDKVAGVLGRKNPPDGIKKAVEDRCVECLHAAHYTLAADGGKAEAWPHPPGEEKDFGGVRSSPLEALHLLDDLLADLEKLRDDIGVELASSLTFKLSEGHLDGLASAVRRIKDDGVQGIGHRHNAGHLRYVFAGKAVGVAVSVPTFVMGTHNRERWAQVEHRFQDLGPDGGVRLHDVEFLGRQRTCLSQNSIGNADLTDIV
jgi:hypothetical protein